MFFLCVFFLFVAGIVQGDHHRPSFFLHAHVQLDAGGGNPPLSPGHLRVREREITLVGLLCCRMGYVDNQYLFYYTPNSTNKSAICEL